MPKFEEQVRGQADQLKTQKVQESLMTEYRAELKTLRKLDPTPRALQFAKINAAWRQKGLKI